MDEGEGAAACSTAVLGGASAMIYPTEGQWARLYWARVMPSADAVACSRFLGEKHGVVGLQGTVLSQLDECSGMPPSPYTHVRTCLRRAVQSLDRAPGFLCPPVSG